MPLSPWIAVSAKQLDTATTPPQSLSREKRKTVANDAMVSRHRVDTKVINRVGRMLKELPHTVQENGNEPLKSIWAGFLFTQEWGVAN